MNKLTLKDVLRMKMKLQGGPGSGNFGHAGRPGKVGGSQSRKYPSGQKGKTREDAYEMAKSWHAKNRPEYLQEAIRQGGKGTDNEIVLKPDVFDALPENEQNVIRQYNRMQADVNIYIKLPDDEYDSNTYMEKVNMLHKFERDNHGILKKYEEPFAI
jgi:hypothetical protein